MEKTLEESLNDLYRIGVIQGEHNINWADEYNLLEHSKNYYKKIKIRNIPKIHQYMVLTLILSSKIIVKIQMMRNIIYGTGWHLI